MCLFLVPLTSFTACEEELPVRYMACDVLEENCTLLARFKDFHSCEYYKTFGDAMCDDYSTPGRIVCDTTYVSPIARSICTR